MTNINFFDESMMTETNSDLRRQYKEREFQICDGMIFHYWAKNEWEFDIRATSEQQHERLSSLAVDLTYHYYAGIPEKKLLLTVAYFRKMCCVAA